MPVFGVCGKWSIDCFSNYKESLTNSSFSNLRAPYGICSTCPTSSDRQGVFLLTLATNRRAHRTGIVGYPARSTPRPFWMGTLIQANGGTLLRSYNSGLRCVLLVLRVPDGTRFQAVVVYFLSRCAAVYYHKLAHPYDLRSFSTVACVPGNALR